MLSLSPGWYYYHPGDIIRYAPIPHLGERCSLAGPVIRARPLPLAQLCQLLNVLNGRQRAVGELPLPVRVEHGAPVCRFPLKRRFKCGEGGSLGKRPQGGGGWNCGRVVSSTDPERLRSLQWLVATLLPRGFTLCAPGGLGLVAVSGASSVRQSFEEQLATATTTDDDDNDDSNNNRNDHDTYALNVRPAHTHARGLIRPLPSRLESPQTSTHHMSTIPTETYKKQKTRTRTDEHTTSVLCCCIAPSLYQWGTPRKTVTTGSRNFETEKNVPRLRSWLLPLCRRLRYRTSSLGRHHRLSARRRRVLSFP